MSDDYTVSTVNASENYQPILLANITTNLYITWLLTFLSIAVNLDMYTKVYLGPRDTPKGVRFGRIFSLGVRK